MLASDASWYDGCAPGSPATPGNPGHNCNELVTALNNRGGFFIGVDVGRGVGGDTYDNNASPSSRCARAPSTARARPVVFGPGSAGIAGASRGMHASARPRVAGSSRQDITTRVVADAMATDVVTGHTTADFIRMGHAPAGCPTCLTATTAAT